MDEAERLYRQAIGLDPWLAIAYTNLGNIRFRRQDPEARRAACTEKPWRSTAGSRRPSTTSATSRSSAATRRSIPFFLGAIQADPKFADAYFNLAMAYEQVGDSQKARPFWKNYIQLEPAGTWTEIAKRHL